MSLREVALTIAQVAQLFLLHAQGHRTLREGFCELVDIELAIAILVELVEHGVYLGIARFEAEVADGVSKFFDANVLRAVRVPRGEQALHRQGRAGEGVTERKLDELRHVYRAGAIHVERVEAFSQRLFRLDGHLARADEL